MSRVLLDLNGDAVVFEGVEHEFANLVNLVVVTANGEGDGGQCKPPNEIGFLIHVTKCYLLDMVNCRTRVTFLSIFKHLPSLTRVGLGVGVGLDKKVQIT